MATPAPKAEGLASHRVNDWVAIAAFCLVAATNQMLWLTFAPVTTDVAAHYGVSEDAVGLLSEIFPLLYVLLAVPAGLLLDRRPGFTLLVAGVLNAGGAMLRLVGDAYAWLLAGQALVAVAQPAILGAITKIADQRLAADRRPLGIALGSASTFAGAVAALALGALLGAKNGPGELLAIGAMAASVALIALAAALARPASYASAPVPAAMRELRAVWGDPVMRRLSAIAFLGFGIFVSLTTWLQVLLEDRGVESAQAGWLLVAMTLAGVAGALVVPAVAIRRGREPAALRLVAIVGAAACAAFAFVHSPAPAAIPAVACGFFLLGALPLLLELTDRRAGAAAASAAALIWLAGNAGGIVVALLLQALLHEPTTAFLVAAVVILAAAPLARDDALKTAVRPATTE